MTNATQECANQDEVRLTDNDKADLLSQVGGDHLENDNYEDNGRAEKVYTNSHSVRLKAPKTALSLSSAAKGNRKE